MTLGHIACAFGKHKIDREAIKRVSGQQVGRCRNCKTPLEEVEPNAWAKPQIRDAGLGPRAFL